ncbi:glycosyltransferase family 4 protein [Sphingobacterium sp. SRCM116780]|uniref:glycosyltransferase family 4 protein n=1 Tax=Sphingobacterium sp. SRCM116780 TaxID=2907623 RepID=UPI001F398736|nr:glycosyltransferase family 4 protein [Sphingobacterium sp. SRCM116780]UIR56000.1 glycosyltransferase family 4 protein [Sphingobacterium sp. SRCM116780]
MKVVYSILGTFNSGGMERVLANKANYLVQLGYDISIITTDQQGRKPYFELDSRIKQYDLNINYTENNAQGLFKKMFSYPRKQKKHQQNLTKLLETIKADITISLFDNDASFLYQIQDGSKKIIEIHFSRYKRIQYARKGLWKWIDAYRNKKDLEDVQRYDKFVVLTQEDQGYWGSLPNITVIPNANSFVPTAFSTTENKRVIAVGRYDYQKGFDDLIQAWKLVKQQAPDWTLDIFGHGPLEQQLNGLINELKLSDVVHLCPPTKAIEQEYIQSSIVAMTSRYEGLPMVLLEAQACGLPMVSYTCKCGPRDIIQEGKNGFLIPEGDQKLFATQVLQLIQQPDLRKKMGQYAQKNAVNYSEAKIMQQWIRLFKEVLNK